jgi:cytidylate kinase
MTHFLIIAVDGPSASGKGTLARRLAEQFHLFYLDTGAVYRAAAKHILDTDKNPDDVAAAIDAATYIKDHLTWSMIDDVALRTDKVADATSRSSRFPEVRDITNQTLRFYAKHPPLKINQHFHGSILDGRDIGTVVCPQADVKLFVTADAEVRAERRFKELTARGIETDYKKVLSDMKERDARDSNRVTAPLKPATDAIILDTSILSSDEAFERAVQIIREKTA